MHAYLEAMDQFVSTQEQLMTGFVQAALRRRAAGRAGVRDVPPTDATNTLDERTGL